MSQDQAVIYLGEAGFFIDLHQKALVSFEHGRPGIDISKMFTPQVDIGKVIWYNHHLNREVHFAQELAEGLPIGTKMYLIPPLRTLDAPGLLAKGGYEVTEQDAANYPVRLHFAPELPLLQKYFLAHAQRSRVHFLARVVGRVMRPFRERFGRKQ